jgi:hypothetical protein
MYFLQGATWHLSKKCKYGSDVIRETLRESMNTCCGRPLGACFQPREKKGGKRVARASLRRRVGLRCLKMLERERKYRQYKLHRLLDKPLILLR